MNKRFLFFLISCLCAIGVRADYALDKELTWDQVKGGDTFFALVSGSDVLYGSGNQDTGMAGVSTAVSDDKGVSLWKVETVNSGFLFRGYNTKGTAYRIWDSDGYLNAQTQKDGVSFILGNTKFTNGQDLANGAVWTVTSTTGGYYIKNVGNGAYLNGTNTSVAADKVWKFYSVKEKQSEKTVKPWFGATPDLHVNGKNLVDPKGNIVTLHGVMDTPNTYFNKNLWNGGYNSDQDVANCLAYFDKVVEALTNPAKGTYCNLFRLHLDPAWSNDESSVAQGFKKEPDLDENGVQKKTDWGSLIWKYTDPNGVIVESEANICYFSMARFEKYLQKVFIPIARKALAHGMYVIMRPPGVFPHDVYKDDYYNKYLIGVWDKVSSDPFIKAHAGQISFELGNEPVSVHCDLAEYFQPIVNQIRKNGFTGIIWAPGSTWQQEYRNYTQKPLYDPENNLGFAVHFYPGWFGTTANDNTRVNSNSEVLNTFKSSVPVQASYPIVVTEVDWSPFKNGKGHINEGGQQVTGNFGTWGTGSTSEKSYFGDQFKYVCDQCGNISWTLQGTNTYVDMATYINSGILQPAFTNEMKQMGFTDASQACSGASFRWFYEYACGDQLPYGDATRLPEGSKTLSASEYYNWTAADNTGIKQIKTGCAYDLYKSTGMPYGDGTVYYLNYADLSMADKLYVVVQEGEPRFLFNRTVDKGTVYGEISANVNSEYLSSINNADGTKTYIVDVKALVDNQGYAHLHAIKELVFDAGVTVTGMYYTIYEPEILVQPFSFDTFAASDFNADDRLLSSGGGGWTFTDGLDLSGYKYLVMTSAQNRRECKTSVYASISDGSKTIEKDAGKSEGLEYTINGNGLWFDTWNNNNIIVMNLEKMRDNGGLDISSIKSLQFSLWGDPDNFYLNNVYATNVLPTYTGDYVKSVATPEKYGTICLPYAAACSGAFVYEVAGKQGDLVYLRRVNIMEAGKPYIYWSVKNYDNNKAEHKVLFYRASKVTNDVAEPVINNGLTGTFTQTTVPYSNSTHNYVLSNNELYFVDSNVNVAANRAYLNLDEVSALDNNSKSVALSIFGGDADAIVSAESESTATPTGFYTLSGVRLDHPQQGVNILRMSDNTYRKVMVK